MGLGEMVNPERKHAGPVEGVVLAAPDTMDDPIFVNILGEDDDDHKDGPCAWMPRGDQFPGEGDVCAVQWTESGTPIVIAWWPGEEWPDG